MPEEHESLKFVYERIQFPDFLEQAKSPLVDEKNCLSIHWRVCGLRFAGIVRKPTADIVIEIYGNHIFGDKKLGIRIAWHDTANLIPTGI